METAQTVQCAKCGRLNPQDAHKCEECDHHLYLTCPECGQLVPRIAHRGHWLRVHGVPEADAHSPPTESTGRDLKVALTAFALVGLLILRSV